MLPIGPEVRIQVIQAGPRTHESVWLELGEGATVGDALATAAFDRVGLAGVAVFGRRVQETDRLRDGDRVELLRPLQSDPKDARRRRAGRSRG